jgi:NADH-quinone oxidoreductase subunit I
MADKPLYTPAERIYFVEIVKGLVITARHFIGAIRGMLKGNEPNEDMWSIQYPEIKRTPSERYRGAHRLNKDEKGHIKCVACYMCATVCPTQCITIEAEEETDAYEWKEKRPLRFEINMLRCMFCGFCVEACPKEAISMTRDYELADYTRADLIYDKERLLANYDRFERGEI